MWQLNDETQFHTCCWYIKILLKLLVGWATAISSCHWDKPLGGLVDPNSVWKKPLHYSLPLAASVVLLLYHQYSHFLVTVSWGCRYLDMCLILPLKSFQVTLWCKGFFVIIITVFCDVVDEAKDNTSVQVVKCHPWSHQLYLWWVSWLVLPATGPVSPNKLLLS